MLVVNLLCLSTLAAAVQPLPAGESMAVMPLQAKRVPTSVAEILDEILVAELDAGGDLKILGVGDINAMLGLERMKDAVGCTDTACAAELGGALGVRYLLTGVVGRLGDELVVQLTLIDVRKSSVERRGHASVPHDESHYRRAIEVAAAAILGREVAPAVQVKPIAKVVTEKTSPTRFRFDTNDPERGFVVQVTSSTGSTHKCPVPVRPSTSCLLSQLPMGRARVAVTSEGLNPAADGFTVRDRDEMHAIVIRPIPALGSITSWALGGVAMFIGTALVATGLPLDIDGLVYGGVPTLLVGAGVVGLGFTFDGKVDVNFPGIDAWF